MACSLMGDRGTRDHRETAVAVGLSITATDGQENGWADGPRERLKVAGAWDVTRSTHRLKGIVADQPLSTFREPTAPAGLSLACWWQDLTRPSARDRRASLSRLTLVRISLTITATDRREQVWAERVWLKWHTNPRRVSGATHREGLIVAERPIWTAGRGLGKASADDRVHGGRRWRRGRARAFLPSDTAVIIAAICHLWDGATRAVRRRDTAH